MKNVNISNCLATHYPEIAEQWHPTKNKLTPYEVTACSGKKVWWKCPVAADHEWCGLISNRTSLIKRGCPFCVGQKVALSNCLAITHPKIASEWHPIKNGELTPYDVTAGSKKRAWWKCSLFKDHEWQFVINSRTVRSRGCSCCAGRTIVLSNCLANINSELAKQWHPVKNGDLTPYDFPPKSSKKVWWQCPVAVDHVYLETIAKRNSQGCPYCAGKKICLSNCLATINPELTKQWHFIKNGNLTPYHVSPNSGKKVWWKCLCGHEWRAVINDRSAGRGCSVCRESKGEKAVAKILTNNNIPFIRQWKHKSCKNKKMLVFDFALKSNKLKIIEYQGEQHYHPIGFGGDPQENFKRVKENDNLKRKWCADNNIPLLEIPYWEEKIEQTIASFI